MAFYLVRGDLVEMNVDVIVANSNVNLKMVEGVYRAIFHKAGDLELMECCRKIGHLDVGKAVLTPSFNIKNTKGIIHAVGPNYINGKHGEEKKLRSAYENVFKIMEENNFHSAAFPILSSDFNYPLRECYPIERDEILKYLKKHPSDDIYVVLYKQPFELFDEDYRTSLSLYINSAFKNESKKQELKLNNKEAVNEIISLMNKKNINENELIFNANLPYDYLDNLKRDENIIPSKNELLSISLSLKLNKDEIENLLSKQGYHFLTNSIYELIIQYYIENNNYNIYDINDILYYFNLETLSKSNS